MLIMVVSHVQLDALYVLLFLYVTSALLDITDTLKLSKELQAQCPALQLAQQEHYHTCLLCTI